MFEESNAIHEWKLNEVQDIQCLHENEDARKYKRLPASDGDYFRVSTQHGRHQTPYEQKGYVVSSYKTFTMKCKIIHHILILSYNCHIKFSKNSIGCVTSCVNQVYSIRSVCESYHLWHCIISYLNITGNVLKLKLLDYTFPRYVCAPRSQLGARENCIKTVLHLKAYAKSETCLKILKLSELLNKCMHLPIYQVTDSMSFCANKRKCSCNYNTFVKC